MFEVARDYLTCITSNIRISFCQSPLFPDYPKASFEQELLVPVNQRRTHTTHNTGTTHTIITKEQVLPKPSSMGSFPRLGSPTC